MVFYNVTVDTVKNSSVLETTSCSIKIYDADDQHVATAIGCSGKIMIDNANFWWPYLMSDKPGYQYTMKACINLKCILVLLIKRLLSI